MFVAIKVTNCGTVKMSNIKVRNFDTAFICENSSSLQINDFQTENCNKSIVLNECWDSDLKNLNLGNNILLKPHNIKLLSHLIKFYMFK